MPAFERRLRRAEGNAGRDQQVGVLVRPVPRPSSRSSSGSRPSAGGRSRSSASTRATARSPRATSSPQYPVPFPSYLDPDEKIAREIKAPANYPITVFLDARGKTAFIHQGGYDSRREALDGGHRPLLAT